MKKVKSFFEDDSGMETLEYAVIAGLIAAVAVFVYLGTGAGGWGSALKERLLASTTTS